MLRGKAEAGCGNVCVCEGVCGKAKKQSACGTGQSKGREGGKVKTSAYEEANEEARRV